MKKSLIVLVAAVTSGCGSNPPFDPTLNPTAPPIASGGAGQGASAEGEGVKPDPRSPSRVLGWVEGDVVTYRDILQLIGPELAQIDSPEEKAKREDQALLQILRDRLLYRAATDAAVYATRDEIDAERVEFVKALAKNGGTLEAYLHEHEMSRREFDEMIRMQLIVSKYRRAAIGHNNDAQVRVRPVTDTYVPPEDVQKYYDRNPAKFQEPARARFRMLAIRTNLDAPDRVKAVAETRARAADVLARLAAGEDWVPVYRSVMAAGADPEHPDGLYEISKGAMASWIETFAFGSEKGTLMSPPRDEGTTSYVLKSEGWRDARTIPFDEAAPEIRRLLSDVRARMAWIEVELNVLDESSLKPDALRGRLRDSLRQARQQLASSAGI